METTQDRSLRLARSIEVQHALRILDLHGKLLDYEVRLHRLKHAGFL